MTRHEHLLALDTAHVWHPFTQMQGWIDDDPIIVESADGNYLLDSLGRRWFDGVSSLWVTVHGHRKRAIDEAIVAQLKRVAHSTLLGQASVPSIELAAKLSSIAPRGLSRVFYSDSGSTSVEVALKMAYQYWQLTGRAEKRRFVALEEAYHGDTLGAVSVGGMELFHDRFRHLLFDVERVPTPHAYRWPGENVLEESVKRIEALFQEKSHTLAAFVIEPLVQGAAGMLVQPRGYLSAVAKLCRDYDVLLVCDEVATGFGRTGTMFACEQEQVTPDLMCVAKGLTGGYLPLAATLASDRIYSAFLGTFGEAKTFFHGHTYTGNQLACAAALANLQLFEDENTMVHVASTARVLEKALDEISSHDLIGDVRQCGMMIGIELVKSKTSKAPFEFEKRVGFQVCRAARTHGVLLRPLGNVVVLMPPLSTTHDEAKMLVNAVRSSVERVAQILKA